MGKGRRLRALRAVRAKAAREAYIAAQEEAERARNVAEQARQAESLNMEQTKRMLLSTQVYRAARLIGRPGNQEIGRG